MKLLSMLAREADIPVFAVAGAHGLRLIESLRKSPGLRLVASPRHARVLLIAGDIGARHAHALERLHAQLPPPRGTVWWQTQRLFARGETVAGDDYLPAIRKAATDDDPDQQPDVPPHPWEGLGPYGQGGQGMMGGNPYGRPMSMTADDIRDGLALDAYTARFGPFLPMLPPGLVLDLTLQGDVIISADVVSPPFEQGSQGDAPDLCAVRILRLMGIGPRAARARGALLALPEGSGTRRRLAAWIRGEETAEMPEPLAEALPGREWAEAVLWLASFPPSRLRAACMAQEAE